jgi:N-acetylglucosaminyldiphosphoundecaprenol N-acetyl-beta-D-mannosaminyltransferase
VSAVRILGVTLMGQRFDPAIETLISAARDRRPMRVHFCNVHNLVGASRDARLRDVFDSAGMVAFDGVPLVWVAKWRRYRDVERVCGPDVMLALCDRGRATGLRHYFLGGAPGVPEALARELMTRYPGLQVAGTMSPPFRALDQDEDRALVAEVNSARPDVLWIGLGAPKQEYWAAEHAAALDAPVLLPVGAVFNFYSGKVRRAPRWMQRAGLEWLFRLAMEPRRLMGRYVSTNTRFAIGILREELGRLRRT